MLQQCECLSDMCRRLTEHVGPVILVVYMVQQINCIRNRAGEIVLVSTTALRVARGRDYLFAMNARPARVYLYIIVRV